MPSASAAAIAAASGCACSCVAPAATSAASASALISSRVIWHAAHRSILSQRTQSLSIRSGARAFAARTFARRDIGAVHIGGEPLPRTADRSRSRASMRLDLRQRQPIGDRSRSGFRPRPAHQASTDRLTDRRAHPARSALHRRRAAADVRESARPRPQMEPAATAAPPDRRRKHSPPADRHHRKASHQA